LIRNVDSPRVSTAIAGIEQETERLNGMVGKLLTLSRMEAGQQLVDKEEIELADLLRQVVEDADFEARNRNCRVILYEAERVPRGGQPGTAPQCCREYRPQRGAVHRRPNGG
jgi:signal transduction histidine kinase